MIPVDWKFEDLAFCLEQLIDYRGKSIPKSDSGVPLITARNVKDGFLDFSEQEYISLQDYTSRMTRGVPQEGDLLFTTEAPLGNTALFPNDGKNYALGQRLVTLRPNKNVVEARYLMYYFLSDFGKKEIKIRATGSTAIGIRQSEFTKIRVLLPPPLEQCKISNILSTWDNAINISIKLIAEKQQYKQGLMQLLLTGKRRFSDFQQEQWTNASFGQIFHIKCVKNTGSSIKNLITVGKYAIRPQNEHFNRIVASDNLENYNVIEKGDFVYDPMSAYYGAFGRYEQVESGIVSPVYRVLYVDSNYDSDFMKHFIKSHYITYQLLANSSQGNREGKRRTIQADAFDNISFKIPTIDEQRAIAKILNACDKELELLNRKLQLFRKQKQGLMQQLLTGKVRVKT